MRIVFFGTDEIALPAFHALVGMEKHDVLALVSQPDRPAGRGRKLRSPYIVEAARKLGIDVIQRENLKGKQTREKINSYGQDINVVFAYGCYIPSVISNHPEHRSINIHPSLLPKHRGANPIRSSIACGDERTGVSIQYVEKTMDTGDILASWEVEIGPDETYDELCGRLSLLGADLLLETLGKIEKGEINPVPQDESLATRCEKWDKSDTIIDWTLPGDDIHNLIRAYSSFPGAQTRFRGKVLKILRTSFTRAAAGRPEGNEPGAICDITRKGFSITVPGGILAVHQVKPEGRSRMNACDFINGFRPEAGERFG